MTSGIHSSVETNSVKYPPTRHWTSTWVRIVRLLNHGLRPTIFVLWFYTLTDWPPIPSVTIFWHTVWPFNHWEYSASLWQWTTWNLYPVYGWLRYKNLFRVLVIPCNHSQRKKSSKVVWGSSLPVEMQPLLTKLSSLISFIADPFSPREMDVGPQSIEPWNDFMG